MNRDDVQALTAQLARDPGSLVFLPLGEALRQRRQLDPALAVAEGGVTRYPEMAGAWDLLARVRSDRGEGDLAFDAWTTVLRLDPDHLGAHKGLAFLCYRSGEYDRSARYLRRAVELAPRDQALRDTLRRVEAAVPPPPPAAAADPLGALEPEPGLALLTDSQGRSLAGAVHDPAGREVSAEAGAALAAAAREAARTARLLRLGPWRSLSVEGGSRQAELRAPAADALLVVLRPRAVPAGRLVLIADRLAHAARRWLEELR
jgi:tetratricopeptide (TPR) repeat protein